MTTPAPFCVSFHDDRSGTMEADFVFAAVARALFESLKEVPTVADAQLFVGGELVEDWRRP